VVSNRAELATDSSKTPTEGAKMVWNRAKVATKSAEAAEEWARAVPE
jgi:hypothetical protein